MATPHNLIWYYDGAALYLYSSGEIATMLIDLQYMKAGEVRSMLAELGVEDARFPLKTTSNDELVMVSGPPRYVALVAEMIGKADRLREKRTFNEVEARIFPLRYTWADDVSFRANSPESTMTIRGVARLLEEIMGRDQGSNSRELSVTNELTLLEARQLSSYHPVIRAENRLNAAQWWNFRGRTRSTGSFRWRSATATAIPMARSDRTPPTCSRPRSLRGWGSPAR